MFREGALLYFKPFIFPDGGEPKAKFFVVLKSIGSDLLLASLPTSKDHIPNGITLKQGCIELPSIMQNAYVFIAGNIVTDSSFSFDVNTFIYGANINQYPVRTFLEQVNSNQIDIESKGILSADIYNDLIRCLKNSSAVKRRYKKML